MEGSLSGQPTECIIGTIADTIHLREVAMATTFWLSMGYNFVCMIGSDMLFDSRVAFPGQALQ